MELFIKNKGEIMEMEPILKKPENPPTESEILDAVKELKESGSTQISLSWLQRTFRIGLREATRIKDKLHELDVIDSYGSIK